VVRECRSKPWRLNAIVCDEFGVSKVKVPVSCFATMGISALHDRHYLQAQLKLQGKLPPYWVSRAAALGGVFPLTPRSKPSLAAAASL
jgi:hypothetical protein